MSTQKPELFTWGGPHGRGAMKARREEKREDAEYRNQRTPRHRRRSFREGPPGARRTA